MSKNPYIDIMYPVTFNTHLPLTYISFYIYN